MSFLTASPPGDDLDVARQHDPAGMPRRRTLRSRPRRSGRASATCSSTQNCTRAGPVARGLQHVGQHGLVGAQHVVREPQAMGERAGEGDVDAGGPCVVLVGHRMRALAAGFQRPGRRSGRIPRGCPVKAGGFAGRGIGVGRSRCPYCEGGVAKIKGAPPGKRGTSVGRGYRSHPGDSSTSQGVGVAVVCTQATAPGRRPEDSRPPAPQAVAWVQTTATAGEAEQALRLGHQTYEGPALTPAAS